MAEAIALVVSIDTEEDNWEPARNGLSVENVRELPKLDRLFEGLGVRATYLTTHEVAKTQWAADVVRGLSRTGRAEIGAHLHPWNTPPISGELTTASTMVANLPFAEQIAKVRFLTDILEATVDERPVVFRAGRWGLDAGTVRAVLEAGYRVDSSVTPFASWTSDSGPSHVGAPVNVYRLDGLSDHRVPAADGELIEVPISRGYTQQNWRFAQSIYRALDAKALRRFSLQRAVERLHLVNHLVLSPEIESLPNMVQLAKRLLDIGTKHLHITFHSSTLKAGLNPFSRTNGDVTRFYSNLTAIVEQIMALTPVRFTTIGEAATLLAPPRTSVQSRAGAALAVG